MGPRLRCVSFPKADPNHYALYRLFIIARFCAPPFPDALVETSRQRPSPAPESAGGYSLYALSVPAPLLLDYRQIMLSSHAERKTPAFGTSWCARSMMCRISSFK